MEHEPRYLYDCGRCKFSWNCGSVCACALPLSREVQWDEPPPWRWHEVLLDRLERHILVGAHEAALDLVMEEFDDEEMARMNWEARTRYERLSSIGPFAAHMKSVRDVVGGWSWEASPEEAACEAVGRGWTREFTERAMRLCGFRSGDIELVLKAIPAARHARADR